jgi:MYXO-CTERM domain-containing protein
MIRRLAHGLLAAGILMLVAASGHQAATMPSTRANGQALPAANAYSASVTATLILALGLLILAALPGLFRRRPPREVTS